MKGKNLVICLGTIMIFALSAFVQTLFYSSTASADQDLNPYWEEYVHKAYIAYYQRPADPAGLKYWAERCEQEGGLDALIDQFADSPEAERRWGTINNDTIGTVVEEVYQGLFGRPADPGGKEFYVNNFKNGTFTAGTIVLNILDGATGEDAEDAAKKLEYSEKFVSALDPDGDYQGPFEAEYDEDDEEAARTLLAGIDSSSGAITAAQVEQDIDDYIDGDGGQTSPEFLFSGGAGKIPEAGFFTPVDYAGAFDPDASAGWADGWTIGHGETSETAGIWDDSGIVTTPFSQSTVGGIPVIDNGDGSITIQAGTMTEDAVLTNDRVWKLAGPVFVGDKNSLPASGEEVTLTIEPGTKIVGLTDTGGLIPYLAVSRGHKIMAEGTKDAPILMTSDTARGSGEWGGLIVTGLAPINRTGGTGQGEGDTGIYGGDNPEDSSGKLSYVVVAHAGHKFSNQNELNGIAFQAVGSGTVIDHIQVHRNKDDGVEFFGGTAEAKYIYLTENEDDSLDWTDGWQGKVQFVSIHKNPVTGDQGIEADNLEEENNASPRSHPVLANLTIRGYADNDYGILLRRGTAANFYNTIISGFGAAQIDIDNAATFNNGGSAAANLTGELTMENSLVFGNGNPLFEDMEEAGEPWNVSDWYYSQDNFEPQDPMLNEDGTLKE